MATYTDNYNLIKPTYAETADILPLDNNFEKIDEVMHSSQISLAPAYDQTKEYAAGDKVMYELLMYKCISPTTGVWDATKWERTTASECGASTKLIGVASGNPASFPDGSDNPLEACNVDITPVQDLHGYSKPWAGGAGKNKIPLTVNDIKTLNNGFTWTDNTFTYNGVTVTLSTDADGNLTKISTNGTCLGNFDVKIAENLSISSGTYILSGSNGGNTSTYYLQGFGNVDYTSGSGILEVDGETQFTLTATNNIRIRLYIRNTADMTGVEIYPMIRESGDSSGFEPYSNICPISGHSSVTVNVSPTSDPAQGTTKTIPFGSTVYGGTLDVTNGELTVTKKIITENDFTMMGGGTSGGGLNYFQIPSTEPKATSGEAISNILEQNQSGWSSTTPCFSTNTGASPNIYPVRVYAASSSLANFKTEYAGLQIVYPLATPQTVQLTPQEVRSILGQNYIEADSGEITVVYVRDLNSCISNIISRLEALEQANSNRSLSLNRGLAKSVEEPQEEPSEELKEEPNEEEVKKEQEVKEEENNDANER